MGGKNKSSGRGNNLDGREELKFVINRFILRYQSGEGHKRLNEFLEENKDASDLLIQEIHRYVVEKYPNADKVMLSAKADKLEKLVNEISIKDFIERRYEYYPFLLKNRDFRLMLGCPKFQINVEGFDRNAGTFRFVNNYIHPTIDDDEYYTESFSDAKFYASRDSKMLFGKIVRQTFKVMDKENYLENFNVDGNEYDPSLAQRGFSVGMFAFLQGKEEYPSLFARLDDDGFTHRNLFIDDYKKRVYGEKAGYPHFHFQNQTDQYICRKEGYNGYETGRCNAIDIPHLIDYLLHIERLSQGKLYERYHKHEDADLPFINIMVERPKFSLKTLKVVRNFMDKLTDDEMQLCKQCLKDFDRKYNSSDRLKGLHYYKNLGFALLLLEFVSQKYWQVSDLSYKKFLASFEIALSEGIMDSICNVTNGVCKNKQNKPITICSDFDENYINYQGI